MADYITFLRFLGAFLVPLMLVLDVSRVFTFFTYVFFALTDALDGYISRIIKTKSDGDIFDPVADKALFICTLFVLMGTQDIPKLASALIILREITVLGLRASAERHNFHIPSSITAKLKTLGGNIAVSSYILRDEYFNISAKFVGDVFFIICFALAMISGAQYISKYVREMHRLKNKKVG